jgi:hypothetical protein
VCEALDFARDRVEVEVRHLAGWPRPERHAPTGPASPGQAPGGRIGFMHAFKIN